MSAIIDFGSTATALAGADALGRVWNTPIVRDRGIVTVVGVCPDAVVRSSRGSGVSYVIDREGALGACLGGEPAVGRFPVELVDDAVEDWATAARDISSGVRAFSAPFAGRA